MTIQRNLTGKIDQTAQRTIEEMDKRLDRLELMLSQLKSVGASGNGVPGLSARQIEDVVGLIGARAQTVIGQETADPQLPGQLAGGTVTSITVTPGNQLTGGGTVTTAGVVTLGVVTTPTFTTVNATNQYNVALTKVIGPQGAAVADVGAADATDLATVITLANELKAKTNLGFSRLRASTGHGLWSG